MIITTKSKTYYLQAVTYTKNDLPTRAKNHKHPAGWQRFLAKTLGTIKRKKMRTWKLITILLLTSVNLHCQVESEIVKYNSLDEWNSDTIQLRKILNENFEGGLIGFYKSIYSEIEYPSIAHSNCKEGVALIHLSIENSKQSIKVLNKIGHLFEDEITKVFNRIENSWIQNKDKIELNVSFRFAINPIKENSKQEKATIEIIGYEMGQGLICDATCDYRTTEYLKEMVDNSLKYQDYESAILYLKELKRRYPFNKQYQKLHDESWKKIEK